MMHVFPWFSEIETSLFHLHRKQPQYEKISSVIQCFVSPLLLTIHILFSHLCTPNLLTNCPVLTSCSHPTYTGESISAGTPRRFPIESYKIKIKIIHLHGKQLKFWHTFHIQIQNYSTNIKVQTVLLFNLPC